MRGAYEVGVWKVDQVGSPRITHHGVKYEVAVAKMRVEATERLASVRPRSVRVQAAVDCDRSTAMSGNTLVT